LYTGQKFAGEKATLVWNKHVLFNGTSNPTQIEDLSNLARVVSNRQTNTHIDQSASTIDNVEQVDVAADGPVIIKGYTTGNFDPQVPSEGYGLATEEGFVASNGITFALTPNVPANAAPGSTVNVGVQVTHTSDLPAHNVDVSIAGAPVVTGGNPQTVTLIPPGQSAIVSWQITAQGSPGVQPLTFTASTQSYGETFMESVMANLNVGGTLLNPSSHQILAGNVFGGSFANVNQSDDVYYTLRPGAVLSNSLPPVHIQFNGTASTTTPTSLAFVIESAGSSSSLQQKLELFNYVTQTWVLVDTSGLSVGDVVYSGSAPGTVSQFVNPVTMAVSARVAVRAIAPTLSFPWSYRIDLAGWSIG
jgi:hypothetical protein